MIKYYLHNGNETEGPFDIEELKSKLITKTTPIWYDGLDVWKTAEEIAELNSLFKKEIPPPFEKKHLSSSFENKSTSSLTFQNSPNQNFENDSIPKNNRKRIIFGAAGLLVVLFTIILVTIYMKPIQKKYINPAKPVVIAHNADISLPPHVSSLNNSMYVSINATIQNQGERGMVRIYFHAYQDGNDYMKETTKWMEADEFKDVGLTIYECKKSGGKITHAVMAEVAN